MFESFQLFLTINFFLLQLIVAIVDTIQPLHQLSTYVFEMATVSAAAAAIQSFRSRLPQSVKTFDQFLKELGYEDVVIDDSSAVNSTLTQYLADHLIGAVKEVEKGLIADDQESSLHLEPAVNIKKMVNINQSRALYTLLELLWLIGLRTTLSSRSGIRESEVQFPTALLLSQEVLSNLRACSVSLSLDNILDIVKSIDFIIHHERFAAFMLHRNLERVLLAYLLLQVEWSNHVDRQTNLSFIQNRLKELFQEATTQMKSLCVSKLRGFTRGNERIKQKSAEYITQILLSSNGLLAVLNGFLEGIAETSHCPAMQVQLAKSLATRPAHVAIESYLQTICAQVLEVWPRALTENDHVSSFLKDGGNLFVFHAFDPTVDYFTDFGAHNNSLHPTASASHA